MAKLNKNRHISDVTENKGIFIILFYDTKEIQNFLKIGKIMLKQNETYSYKSISSSSSKGSGSTLSVSSCSPVYSQE